MIKDNQLVLIHFVGKTKDGKIFDTSRNGSPLRYVSNKVPSEIPSHFVDKIKNHQKGDIIDLVMTADESFGPYNPYLVQEIEVEKLPDNKNVGDYLTAISENYGQVNLVIKSIEGNKAILDANHPLAGQDLYYEVEIIDVIDL